jgi:hypothetical protein
MLVNPQPRRRRTVRPAVKLAGTLGAGLVATGLALALAVPAASASDSHHDRQGRVYRQVGVINIPRPGGPLFADIIFGDQRTQRIYLSDLANSSLDIIDAKTSRLVAQVGGFTGGPAGVLSDDLGQVWAGDGSGAIKVVSGSAPYKIVDSIPVGAPTADEIAYDPVDRIIAVTSPDAKSSSGAATPWVTLIDARPGRDGKHRVLGHVVIPGAGPDAIEQPQWDQSTGTFVEAVRSTGDLRSGAVIRIDPKRIRVESILPIDVACNPGGLAVGLHGQMLLGCNTGVPVLMDGETGRILAQYSGHNASGADEVWFNSADNRFYAAEAGAAGPPPIVPDNFPTVMVIDAVSGKFVTNIALDAAAPGFHQVTAVGDPARVFVPESDGLHVYSASRRD